MSSYRPPRRFAILAGVNVYPSNGSRSWEANVPVQVNQLYGCVNDVRAVQDFVQEAFGIHSPHVLTAEANGSRAGPKEHPKLLPTYVNIKSAFEKVQDEARPGDLFLFYFSGHGALLPVREKSPKDGRQNDPSLLTYDYCCGRPAVRGWQLNTWLKALHQKKVQIAVILDSCYSGGSWRSGAVFRTPDSWTTPPNIQADEDAMDDIAFSATESTVEAVDRDARLTQAWGIDSRWFTLMTACRSDELAEEETVYTSAGMKQQGIFTHRLLLQLRQSLSRIPTYRILRDQIDNTIKTEKSVQLRRQTPQVYGRDRLTFLSDREQFSAASNVVRVQDSQVIVPLGQMHGIYEGAEFTTCSQAKNYTIKIEWVDAMRGSQKVDSAIAHYFRYNNEVILSRPSLCPPSLGQAAFRVYLDRNLGNALKSAFLRHLQYRISGRIEYVDGEFPGDHFTSVSGSASSPVHSLGLRAIHGGLEVIGTSSLLGYTGRVRGLKLREDKHDGAVKTASASVAHLMRFSQILDLRRKAHKDNPRFSATVTPRDPNPIDNSLVNTWDGISYGNKQKVKYNFTNHSGRDLHITVLTLGSGFHVRQLWPTNTDAVTVGPGEQARFKFTLEVPPELYMATSALHRDIIRTVVTDHKGPSFRGIELPDIWDTCKQAKSTFRNATNVSDDDDIVWWVDDTVVFTRDPEVTRRKD